MYQARIRFAPSLSPPPLMLLPSACVPACVPATLPLAPWVPSSSSGHKFKHAPKRDGAERHEMRGGRTNHVGAMGRHAGRRAAGMGRGLRGVSGRPRLACRASTRSLSSARRAAAPRRASRSHCTGQTGRRTAARGAAHQHGASSRSGSALGSASAARPQVQAAPRAAADTRRQCKEASAH